MEATDPRLALTRLAREQGESLAGLSAWLGRNPAYLQQFVTRGSPRRLAEQDRRALAGYLGVDEAVLGGPSAAAASPILSVPRYDVAVSAGPGAVGEDRVEGAVTIDSRLVRSLGASAADLSIVRATGASMTPTIEDGDDLLVDRGDRAPGGSPAIYVLRIDGVLLVKRVYRAGKRLVIASDNPAAPALPDVEAGAVEVLGRVVHLARRLR